MKGRAIKNSIIGAFFMVVMLIAALGTVYLIQNVLGRLDSPEIVEEVVIEESAQEDYRQLIGTKGYELMIVKKDNIRQQYYVDKVCIATGEIVASYWVDFNKVDLGVIAN